MPASAFPPIVQAVIAEFIPICRGLAGDQRYAIAVGGSLGKGTWDSQSDIDFRLFTDRELPRRGQNPDLWSDYTAAIAGKNAASALMALRAHRGEIDVAIDGWFRADRPGGPDLDDLGLSHPDRRL
jgi:hypothetical protein